MTCPAPPPRPHADPAARLEDFRVLLAGLLGLEERLASLLTDGQLLEMAAAEIRRAGP